MVINPRRRFLTGPRQSASVRRRWSPVRPTKARGFSLAQAPVEGKLRSRPSGIAVGDLLRVE